MAQTAVASHSISIRLACSALELLTLLLENRDKMISKEEIYQTIWEGRIVSEAALSSRIKMVRQVLGDDGKQQRIIRTVHGKGFRFVASVLEQKDAEPTKVDAVAEALPEEVKVSRNNIEPLSRPAIAVLPFLNLSADAEQEYLSDGISSDIMSYLAKHRWLKVTARNTMFSYKGRPVDTRTLSQELNVNYVVEGSVQRAGQRVRITVNLVDAKTGHQLWGDSYNRQISDIFALQDEITKMIAARLEPAIGFSERNKVVHSHPANLKAWDCYHMGISHFFRFTGDDNIEAQRLLRRSQQLDPDFGEAYSW